MRRRGRKSKRRRPRARLAGAADARASNAPCFSRWAAMCLCDLARAEAKGPSHTPLPPLAPKPRTHLLMRPLSALGAAPESDERDGAGSVHGAAGVSSECHHSELQRARLEAGMISLSLEENREFERLLAGGSVRESAAGTRVVLLGQELCCWEKSCAAGRRGVDAWLWCHSPSCQTALKVLSIICLAHMLHDARQVPSTLGAIGEHIPPKQVCVPPSVLRRQVTCGRLPKDVLFRQRCAICRLSSCFRVETIFG